MVGGRVTARFTGWAAIVVLTLVVSGCSAPDAPVATVPTTSPVAAAPTSVAAAAVTTPVVASTTTGTTQPAPAPAGPVTLAFSGDLLLHMPINERAAANGRDSGKAFDFGPMLDPLRPVLDRADVAVCHLEVPLTPTGRLSGYPSFAAPTEVVPAIAAAGFDGCSTASNHTLDQGRAGIQSTLEHLDAAGLRHAGSARGGWESGPALYEVRGVQIAHLSYAYGFNGYRIPADAPWAVNQIDPTRIRADARSARIAGADLVVVSLHWGTEYRSAPDAYQRDVAAAILPSPDIDLVVGHHAHVVQPIELVNGTYVVWGLGNQLARQPQVPRSDGLTVLATANPGWDGRWRISGMEAVPTWVEPGSFRVLPVTLTLADPVTPPALRAELVASYQRTMQTVGPGISVAPLP